MTDKVQKIKNWISKEQDGLMDAQGNFEFPEHEGAYHILSNLDTYIDSLQEELVSSIWHNASEKSNEPENVVIINPFDNTGEVLTKCVDVYQGHIWAYTSELLKLYNLCKVGKNLQEEPVSEELGEYINELSKQFPEVSFAKLSRIVVRVAKWQKDKMMLNTIDATCFGFQGAALFSFRLPAGSYLVGSKVKVIVIKED